MNKRVQPIGGDIKIVISDEVNFTTDSVLLANFSSPSPKTNVMEIGSGCGIIPLLWCRNKKLNKITAVEINKVPFEMMCESIKLNNLEDRILALNEDIKVLASSRSIYGRFDMVVCNPPYFPVGSCKTLNRSLSRHENTITLEEIIKISSLFLKYGGKLCLCCRTDRLCDIVFFMRKFGIEPKLLRFVEYKQGKSAELFLIKGQKGAKTGLILKNNLVVQMKNGVYSDEVNEIYNNY